MKKTIFILFLLLIPSALAIKQCSGDVCNDFVLFPRFDNDQATNETNVSTQVLFEPITDKTKKGFLQIPLEPSADIFGGGAGALGETEECFQDNDCLPGLLCINSTCQYPPKMEEKIKIFNYSMSIIGGTSIFLFGLMIFKKKEEEEEKKEEEENEDNLDDK